MKVFRGPIDLLEEKAAEILEETVNQIADEKLITVLGISGGNDLTGIFEKLKEVNVDWTKIEVFVTDDGFVASNNEESNFEKANEAFISDLIEDGRLPLRGVHDFNYRAGVEGYENEFFVSGGKFDVAILSLGGDGSVASIFPRSKALIEKMGFVLLDKTPKKPKKRITATKHLLEQTDTVLLFAYGEEKRTALEALKNENVSMDVCPAKLLLGTKNLYLFTDL